MASSGPLSPGTIATSNASGGSVDWTNPTNAAASDNSRATITLGFEEIGYYLKCTNFGFALPGGAVVTDVVVEVECQSSAIFFACEAYLVKAGTIQTGGSSWGTMISGTVTGSDAYIQMPDEPDRPSLWGVTLSDSDVNNSGFGVAFFIQDTGGGSNLSVDHVRMTVYYTAAVTLTGDAAITQAANTISAAGTVTSAGPFVSSASLLGCGR